MTTVNLPGELVNQAKRHAGIENRSVPKQIEHWAKIGNIAEENSDLPYEFIEGILIGLEEIKNGEVSEYQFGPVAKK